VSTRDFLEAAAVEIIPSGPLVGACDAPASKSLTNRLLLMAALAEGRSRLVGPLRSDDSAVMSAGLVALGAGIGDEGDAAVVTGTGGRLREPAGVIAAGLSGTTLRWLSAAALLVHGTVVIDGEPPLRKRPMAPLLRSLEDLGASIDSDDGCPPLHITSTGLRGGRVRVDAAESSQFATSLLLVAPYAESDLELEVAHLGAVGYVELTIEAMLRWGAAIESEGAGRYLVTAGRHYQAREEVVEYDASAAVHLFALAMATGGNLTVRNVMGTRQPDAGMTAVFEEMGGDVTAAPGGGVTVSRPGPLRGVDVDIAPMPDQVPALAVLGALAEGTTRLRNVSVARGHETDRVAAVARELRKLGAGIEEDGDSLVIEGGRPLSGGTVETYDDHRMAMAFSSLGAAVPGVVVTDPGCVRKTYPQYWRDVAALGVGLRAVD
jgi:3-phosphoshikimate 1-carboxyvinyltransferase